MPQTLKHYPGCYRVRMENSDIFGQIKRSGRKWNAEIRYTATGELKHFAGIWSTKREAVQESLSYIERAAL